MGGKTETEVKLRMAGPDEARSAVDRLGAAPSVPRHLEDNVLYDDARRSLAASGQSLRLRRAAGRAVLTLKGPRLADAGVKSRREDEVTVSHADALDAILRGLGLVPVFRYQKYREALRWRDAEVVIDETPIGTFVEIEGPVETIHAAAAALGRSPADFVLESYPALFAAAGGRGDMVFP